MRRRRGPSPAVARREGTDSGLASLAPGPFVALVGSVLLAGMAALLGLNTVLAQDSFHLHTLKTSTQDLAAQKQQLEARVQALGDPGALAQSAQQLGMVPGGAPAFVQGGQVVGAGSGPAPDGTTVDGTLVVRTATPSPTATTPPVAPRPAPTTSAATSASPKPTGSPTGKPTATSSAKPSGTARSSASPSGTKKPTTSPAPSTGKH